MKLYYTLSNIARSVKKMKGKICFWAFCILLLVLVQLLIYYATNLTLLNTIAHQPFYLIINVGVLSAVIYLLVWLFRQVEIEDKHEKEVMQQSMKQSMKEAIKEALREGREQERKGEYQSGVKDDSIKQQKG